jgi:hypothetical protein
MNQRAPEIDRACECAQQISENLQEAVGLSEKIATSMGKLAADPLLVAANRRETLNASVAALTSELGFVLQKLANRYGWQDMTVARIGTVAPAEAARLQSLLAEINSRAAALRDLDGRNRARGGAALKFLRSALGTQPTSVAAYNRRGAALGGGALSTASRRA